MNYQAFYDKEKAEFINFQRFVESVLSSVIFFFREKNNSKSIFQLQKLISDKLRFKNYFSFYASKN